MRLTSFHDWWRVRSRAHGGLLYSYSPAHFPDKNQEKQLQPKKKNAIINAKLKNGNVRRPMCDE
ncbi:hypothetical protein D7X87_02145 [bacterium D16-54]|nr:hypothetical protein D7X87_02145 [bacterium D16-54]RKJ16455.1 hypothetical protein D7X65_02145 [bacterium D16-56]